MKKRTSLQITLAVVFALVLREVRGRFGMNRLGAFWFIFEPIAHTLILLVIWSSRDRYIPGVEVPIFVITGVIPYILFKNIALRGMEAVNANRALFSYKQIMPFDTMIARAIIEIFLMACAHGALMFGLAYWGGFHTAPTDALSWLLVMAIGVCFSFGLALIFCAIIQLFPELRTFIRLLFLPLYFLSGVILPLWLVPPRWLDWMLWNPFTHLIDLARYYYLPNYPAVPGISLGYPAAIAIVTLFIGMGVYRLRRRYLIAL